ncbi:MAG: hypothetical protein WA323_24025 [Candidatus Nitrosopolaris sp.]
MNKILDNLATHGIGEPGLLKGYSECKEGLIDNFRIVDVRTVVDGENPLFEYELNIIRVVSYLELGEKVVICCRAGVSRSNAIALGVLVHFRSMPSKRLVFLMNLIYLIYEPICI